MTESFNTYCPLCGSQRRVNVFGSFGERLLQVRTAVGMTQLQLSNAMGAHQSLICQFETGRRRPSYENLIKLIEALSCPPAALIPVHAKNTGAAPVCGMNESSS